MSSKSRAKDRIVTRASLDISRFLRGSILWQPSSVELGWKNLAVEQRTIVPSEFSKLTLDKHFLILWEGHVVAAFNPNLRKSRSLNKSCANKRGRMQS